MGVLAGWEPPFGVLIFAGVCFSSSGESRLVFPKVRFFFTSCAGTSNTILFIVTRHTLIKQVARYRGPRIHVSTERVTDHENIIELSNVGDDPFVGNVDEDKSSTSGFDISEEMDAEPVGGYRFSVVGK